MMPRRYGIHQPSRDRRPDDLARRGRGDCEPVGTGSGRFAASQLIPGYLCLPFGRVRYFRVNHGSCRRPYSRLN